LLYDLSFLELASIPLVLEIARNLLGSWVVLHLQNALINRSEIEHPQAVWHRDLPHQNFVVSKPLAVSAITVIDDFTKNAGGTRLLPFSHQSELLPSASYIEKCAIDVEAAAGSVLIFDSMLFHQGGFNMSGQVRRAVNHIYVRPILKQQYDFSRALGANDDFGPDLMQLLGYTSQVSLNDRAWRNSRIDRVSKAK
jgi:ectoine hydroxylase-related dioxygenase (phytanoyl-CoA dioxygenase family)